MKTTLSILLVMGLFGGCKKDSPAEQCYSCANKLTVYRTTGIEETQNPETVCGASAAATFEKRYNYTDTLIATRTRVVSTAKCTLLP